MATVCGVLRVPSVVPNRLPTRVGRQHRLLLGSSTNGASSAIGLCSSKQNRQSQDQTRREMLLITSEWEPNPGKLVPSRVQMKSDKVIEVERKGKRWEVKRIELQFTSQQDATKAIEMLKQTSSGSVLPGGVESRILQVRYSLGYAWMVTVLRPIIPTRSIMLS